MSDLRATLVAIRCFLRGLPLFFRSTPRTPLRALGIIALDTLHVLRHSRPLSPARVTALSLFVDFEGCANASWDHKDLCQAEYRAIRKRLKKAGLGACMQDYLGRLATLESRRPTIAGDRLRFDEVRSYREGVAELSLSTAAAIALNTQRLEQSTRAGDSDADIDALVRILLQCQVIDDIIDYQEDLSAGLPSFLTASASLPQAIGLTAEAARSYGSCPNRGSVLPLRIALWVVTSMTALLVRLYAIRHSPRPHSAWRWTTTSRH